MHNAHLKTAPFSIAYNELRVAIFFFSYFTFLFLFPFSMLDQRKDMFGFKRSMNKMEENKNSNIRAQRTMYNVHLGTM